MARCRGGVEVVVVGERHAPEVAVGPGDLLAVDHKREALELPDRPAVGLGEEGAGGELPGVGVGVAEDEVRGGSEAAVAGEPGPAGDPGCLLYTSPSPRDGLLSRMPSSA